MNIDELINKFRVASRELFNNCFRIEDAWNKQDDAWDLKLRFDRLDKRLFAELVSETFDNKTVEYGELQPNIKLTVRLESSIMVNREIDSGYWDFPISLVTSEAVFGFIEFFDWDTLRVRDNQFVRAQVLEWSSHPEAIGKQVLVGANDVVYSLSES